MGVDGVGRSLWRSPRRWAGALGLLGLLAVGLWALPVGAGAEGAGGEPVGRWYSLLPPLVAIVLALCFRSLVGALTIAFVVGCLLSFWPDVLGAVPRGLAAFVWASLRDEFNLAIFVFLFALVGLIHLVGRAGGLQGLVNGVAARARGPRSARLATALAGAVIFFDDYSSVVVTGTAMRGVTDRFRVSREKLAYLADSTCAPIAGLAVISTWIAWEVLLLGGAMAVMGRPEGGYEVFWQAVPMRFYCWGTLLFVGLGILWGRDFGPMLAAERRAARGEGLGAAGLDGAAETDGVMLGAAPGVPARWWNAALPLGLVVVGALAGIIGLGAWRMTAAGETFALLSAADWRAALGYTTNPAYGGGGAMGVLCVAALLGGGLAVVLVRSQRLLSWRECAAAYGRAFPTLRLAFFILVMAWAMKGICTTGLHADTYLVALLSDRVPLAWLPLGTFLVAAAVSFATGTSFGTMGILIPLAVPLAGALGANAPGQEIFLWLTAAAVLDGSIFGDHVSPISDTTVLASLSAGCAHVEHVRTQAVYAVTVMVLVAVLGYGAVAAGVSPLVFWIGLPLAVSGLFLTIGRRPEGD